MNNCFMTREMPISEMRDSVGVTVFFFFWDGRRVGI